MMSAASSATSPLRALLADVREDGSEESWRLLVEQFTPQLYRVARGLTAWRVLGAQTAVQHAWRAATRSPDTMVDPHKLRRTLLREVIRRARALGDSPRDRTTEDICDRTAAMRAVALLPRAARSVLVLADLGGVPIPEIANLLSMPEARVKSELWHARLAVDTLRGAGSSDHVTAEARVPQSPSEQSAADAAVLVRGGEGEIAELWQESLPEGFVDRLVTDLRSRQVRRLARPHLTSRRITILGVVLATTLAAGGVALWHGLSHRTAAQVAPVASQMPPSTLAQR